jgi:hypothetical protein
MLLFIMMMMVMFMRRVEVGNQIQIRWMYRSVVDCIVNSIIISIIIIVVVVFVNAHIDFTAYSSRIIHQIVAAHYHYHHYY